jgi:hypothetical protein
MLIAADSLSGVGLFFQWFGTPPPPVGSDLF